MLGLEIIPNILVIQVITALWVRFLLNQFLVLLVHFELLPKQELLEIVAHALLVITVLTWLCQLLSFVLKDTTAQSLQVFQPLVLQVDLENSLD